MNTTYIWQLLMEIMVFLKQASDLIFAHIYASLYNLLIFPTPTLPTLLGKGVHTRGGTYNYTLITPNAFNWFVFEYFVFWFDYFIVHMQICIFKLSRFVFWLILSTWATLIFPLWFQ